MDKNGRVPGQKVYFDMDKNGHRVGQKCPTTNNTTIKENNKRNKATPSPLPPKGAPALLTERNKQADAQVQNFLRNFGKKRKQRQPMPEKEFQRRKEAQLKALLGI